MTQLTNRRTGSPGRNNQITESGTVEVQIDGETHVGSYVVHAFGRGRQRYRVTPEKGITVSYCGRTKHTTVGSDLAGVAHVLMVELVDEARNSTDN